MHTFYFSWRRRAPSHPLQSPLTAPLASGGSVARPSEGTTVPNRSRARKRPISIDSEEVSAGDEQFVVPVMVSKAKAALRGGGIDKEGNEAVQSTRLQHADDGEAARRRGKVISCYLRRFLPPR